MEPDQKVVVVVSLPPPDNPSQGKTITSITISSNPQTHQTHQTHDQNHPFPPPSYSPSPLSFLPSRKTLAFLLGFTFLFSYLCVSLFNASSPLQLLSGSDPSFEETQKEDTSFWLPLYPKSRGNRSSLLAGADVKLVSNVVKEQSVVRSGIDSSAVLPLRGNIFPDGQYYTSIFIGSPPRPYFLDVDTGSDLTWIQCDAPCTSCAKGPHPLYKPTKGKIVPPKDSLCLEVQRSMNSRYCDSCQQCDYEIEYADHSSSMGVLARDEMHLIIANGDRAKFDFAFGCAYDQQGQLLASPAKTDGILGLSSGKVSLPSQLASQGITNNVVGHCITNVANGGGYMFFGVDFVPRWGMTWVPIVISQTNFYQTEVRKLSYGGRQISMAKQGNSVGQVVFDTGSSYTYFPNETYATLISSLESVSDNLVLDDSDQTLPVCWRTDHPISSVGDVKQLFEPLTLQFANRWLVVPTTFTIPPEGYLIISNKGNVCLGVLNGSEVHDGSTIILGGISLRGKMVVYDNVQRKVGWVSSDCAKPQRRPKDFPFFF